MYKYGFTTKEGNKKVWLVSFDKNGMYDFFTKDIMLDYYAKGYDRHYKKNMVGMVAPFLFDTAEEAEEWISGTWFSKNFDIEVERVKVPDDALTKEIRCHFKHGDRVWSRKKLEWDFPVE